MIAMLVDEPDIIDSQVAAMALDKEIQEELEKINEEFAGTEMDGLQGNNLMN